MSTFHNDINKVADMLLLSKEEFLSTYSYLTEADYFDTMRNLLFNGFSLEQREDYYNYLINEGESEFARKVLEVKE